jgi:hypothetical protein
MEDVKLRYIYWLGLAVGLFIGDKASEDKAKDIVKEVFTKEKTVGYFNKRVVRVYRKGVSE